jgi:hypothetical protein
LRKRSESKEIEKGRNAEVKEAKEEKETLAFARVY